MKKSGSKVLIIVLMVIALLAIAGGTFAYTYFCTDTLKSGQELFAKYLTQNLEELNQTINLNKVGEVEEKLKQNKYEETITISYTEDGKTLPNGTTAIDIQNDPINKKIYGIISLATQDPEETLKLEYMKESDIYALRFTNAVKQFLSVENSGLKQLANNLGIDEETVDKIPNTIDFERLSFDKLKITDEEKNTEINRYLEVLYNNIAKEKYTKSKNTVITLNGNTITTNAYRLTLNAQDMKTLAIKLLETLKQDEVVLGKLQILDEMIQEYSEESLKTSFAEALQESIDELNEEVLTEELEEDIVIIVYEKDGKTVRVKVEQGLQYVTLDTTDIEGKKQIDIDYTNIDEDNTQSSNGIKFIKENDNKLIIQLNTIDGEEQQSNEVNVELIENENNIKLNITVADEEGKTALSRDINFVDEINYKVKLDSSTNIVLNELSSEQMANIFALVGEKLNTEYVEKFQQEHFEPFKLIVKPITTIMMYNIARNSLENIPDNFFGEAEIEEFNHKFKAYEGTNLSTPDVNALLNTVLMHNMKEVNELTEHYVVVSGDVTLEADATSITRVEGNKYYNVECKTDSDGFVNEIVIRSLVDLNPEQINDAE